MKHTHRIGKINCGNSQRRLQGRVDDQPMNSLAAREGLPEERAEALLACSMDNNEKTKIQSIKIKAMKNQQPILKVLMMLLLVAAGTLGTMAQDNPSPTQIVCIGNEPYRVDETLGSTYTWTITGGTAGTDWQINGNTHTIDIDWLVPGIYTLQMVEMSALQCEGPPNIVTVTVLPKPTVDAVPPLAYCNGILTDVIVFSGTGELYSWVNDHPEIGLAALGTGDIIPFTAVNTTAEPIIATITVTPSVSSGATSCEGEPITFTITVNPSTTVDQVLAVDYCDNEATEAITFTSPVAGTTFAWTNSEPGIGLAALGDGDLPVFTAVNTGTSPIVATITVTPSANGCEGAPMTFTITVNPIATVNPVAALDFCDGEASPEILFESPVSGTTFTWTNSEPGIGLEASGSGPLPIFTAVNTGTTPIVATITVTPTADGCEGTDMTFTITIYPRPVPTIEGESPLCAGITEVYTTEADMSNYTWTVSAGGTITAGGTDTDHTVTIIWNTAGDQTVTVNYDNANGCSASTPTVKDVRVDPVPVTSPIFHN